MNAIRLITSKNSDSDMAYLIHPLNSMTGQGVEGVDGGINNKMMPNP